MTKGKWYSPQLSREIVGQLYRRAKVEHVPMAILANRLIKQALGSNDTIVIAKPDTNNTDPQRNFD
jgi:hypothetical protein